MKNKIVAISAILIAVLVAVPLVGAQGTSYTFTFVGPNVSKAEAAIPGTHVKANDLIRFTGSGTFDTSTKAASGGGSFTHINFDGTVHGKGTWTVTKFLSFTSYGGPNPGMQGGLLRFIIHAVNIEGEEFTFIVQVSCRVNAPPGAPDEGVTVWAPSFPVFGIVVSGHTLFHLNE